MLAAVVGEGVEEDVFCIEVGARIEGGGGEVAGSGVSMLVDLTDLVDLELLKYLEGLMNGRMNLEKNEDASAMSGASRLAVEESVVVCEVGNPSCGTADGVVKPMGTMLDGVANSLSFVDTDVVDGVATSRDWAVDGVIRLKGSVSDSEADEVGDAASIVLIPLRSVY